MTMSADTDLKLNSATISNTLRWNSFLNVTNSPVCIRGFAVSVVMSKPILAVASPCLYHIYTGKAKSVPTNVSETIDTLTGLITQS